MADPIDLSQIASHLATAGNLVGEPPRPGTLLMKVGRIARLDWFVRAQPDPNQPNIDTFKLNDVVFVERTYKTNPTDDLSWLYVFGRPNNGENVVEGWVRSDGVFMDPPEPDSLVKFIHSKDKLINIAARYKPYKWGGDARFYVAALAYVNRNYGGLKFPKGWTDADFLERGRWADIEVKSGHGMWLPTKEYLEPLKGQFVSSGSISYELYRKMKKYAYKLWEMVVGTVAFAGGLVHGALSAVYDALTELVELAKMVWKVLKSLFTLQIVKDAKKLWDTLKGIDWKAAMAGIADDFMAKWEADSTWTRCYFQGKVIGYVMATAALAFLTAGATAAVSALGKGSKLAKAVQIIMNNPVVKKVLNNGAVKTLVDKAEGGLKKSQEIQKKLADWVAAKRGLFRGLRLTRGYDSRMGIPDEHFKAMVEAAHDTGVIAIFRANKKAAIPLIRRGAHGKPMWAKFKTSKDTGVLTATEGKDVLLANKHGHWVVSNDKKSLYKYDNSGKMETKELPKDVFWKLEPGQVIHPDGKPVVGDYDLLGVAPIDSPGRNITLVPDDVAFGDWNGPDVQKFADAANGKMGSKRVLHGAQDGYGGNPKYMGLTDDTAYAVFPDGQTYIMEGKQAQQKFYDTLGRQAKQPDAPVGKPGWHLDGDRVVR